MNRILGGAEVLMGAGLIVATALTPDAKELAIPFYIGGSLAAIDGGADLISGRCAYLIEKTVDLAYYIQNKNEKKKAMKIGEKSE